MGLVRTHSFRIDLDIGKNGEKKSVEVIFFKDFLGRIRLLADAELPAGARNFKGTLLHALLSTEGFGLTRTEQGARIIRDGKVVEYEFTLTTKDGRFGIPYSTNPITGIRKYIDLRNVKLSDQLDGAVVSIKINSVNCDLKDSAVKEIRRVYKSFSLYNLDGSQTLVYAPEKSPKGDWPLELAWEQGLLGQKWLLPAKFLPNPQVSASVGFGRFGKSQPPLGLAWSRKVEEKPSMPANCEALQQPGFAAGNFDVMAEGLPNRPALHQAAQGIQAGAQAVAKTPIQGPAMGAGAHLDFSRAVFFPPEQQKQQESAIKPVPFSSLRKFRAVIFDLDGSIVDSERAHLLTFNKTFALLGLKIAESNWRRNYTGIGSFAIVEDLFRRNGIKASAREWVQKRAAVYQKHIEKHGLPVIAGFKEFHSLLMENGIKVAVGSGGHKPHIAASLKSIGLQSVPFIGLEDVKNRKPAPDTFLRAAAMIGVRPDECIVVEDALSGIRAASAAGMPCIALTTTLPRRELEGKAAIIVPNFKSARLKRMMKKIILGGKGGSPAKMPKKRKSLQTKRGKK